MSNRFYIYFNDYIIDNIKYIIMEENNNIEINQNTHKNCEWADEYYIKGVYIFVKKPMLLRVDHYVNGV